MPPALVLNEIKKEERKLLEANPENLMGMLSKNEYNAFNALCASEHALTVKAVQRKIVENRLWKSRKAWATEGFFEDWQTDLDAEAEGVKVFYEVRGEAWLEKNKVYAGDEKVKAFLDGLPVQRILTLARKTGVELEAPSDSTVKSALENLVAEGFVGKRELKEDERATAHYFVVPTLAKLLVPKE